MKKIKPAFFAIMIVFAMMLSGCDDFEITINVTDSTAETKEDLTSAEDITDTSEENDSESETVEEDVKKLEVKEIEYEINDVNNLYQNETIEQDLVITGYQNITIKSKGYDGLKLALYKYNNVITGMEDDFVQSCSQSFFDIKSEKELAELSAPYFMEHWVSIGRADSAMFSYLEFFDWHLYPDSDLKSTYGINIDSQSGEDLHIRKVITDMNGLKQLVKKKLKEHNEFRDILYDDWEQVVDSIFGDYAHPNWVGYKDGIDFFFTEYLLCDEEDAPICIWVGVEENPELFNCKYFEGGTGNDPADESKELVMQEMLDAGAVAGIAYLGHTEGPMGDGLRGYLINTAYKDKLPFVLEIDYDRYIGADGDDYFQLLFLTDRLESVAVNVYNHSTKATEDVLFKSEEPEPIVIKCDASGKGKGVQVCIMDSEGIGSVFVISVKNGKVSIDAEGRPVYDYSIYE
ncbi:MAG: hypothetical protein ACOX75_08290 [Lachnospiraceae bacterium]